MNFFFPENREFVMEHFFSKTFFPEMTEFCHKKVISLAPPENYLMSIAT
jgi:hypothetical protein